MTHHEVIIEFDHRDDRGPRRVGPFPSRRAALAHVDDYIGIRDAVWTIVPLTHPDDDHPRLGS
jgi:hypothetical protein